jgi:hypothetical protein
MAAGTDDNATLRAYDQLCVTYRAIDDFRSKLLGFLPLATGGGLALLTGRADGLAEEFFAPAGVFGVAVTLGLFTYEIYGIRKCHALIEAGKKMEAALGLASGQFTERPRSVLGHINEPFAAAVIYPAVVAAWIYLAAFHSALGVGTVLAPLAFALGFAMTVEYSRRLGQRARRSHA